MLIEDMTNDYFYKHYKKYDYGEDGDKKVLNKILIDIYESPHFTVVEDIIYKEEWLIIDTDKKIMDNIYEKLKLFYFDDGYFKFKDYYIIKVSYYLCMSD